MYYPFHPALHTSIVLTLAPVSKDPIANILRRFSKRVTLSFIYLVVIIIC
jgi:hypothetical protein